MEFRGLDSNQRIQESKSRALPLGYPGLIMPEITALKREPLMTLLVSHISTTVPSCISQTFIIYGYKPESDANSQDLTLLGPISLDLNCTVRACGNAWTKAILACKLVTPPYSVKLYGFNVLSL